MLEDNKRPFFSIGITEKGYKIVELESIAFPGKRKIDWEGVETYLKRYVGEKYTIEETGQDVHISSDFPDEYANSKNSAKAFGTIGKAKANASQIIPELILTATDIIYRPNLELKHQADAPNGWYRCNVRFSLPTTNDKGEKIGKNRYLGRMIIRCDSNNCLHLYDIIDIKKET